MRKRRMSDDDLAREIHATMSESALQELVDRHGNDLYFALHRYRGSSAKMVEKAVTLNVVEGLIVAAVFEVVAHETSFAHAFRLEARDALLARAPRYSAALLAVADPIQRPGLEVLLQASAEEQLIVTAIVRTNGVVEELLPEDGFLTAPQLGHLLDRKPGEIHVISSRMKKKIREAGDGPKEERDV